jgi:hypothetical protein
MRIEPSVRRLWHSIELRRRRRRRALDVRRHRYAELRPSDSPDAPADGRRYRSRAAEIEAVQWTRDNTDQVEKFTLVRRTFEHGSDGEVSCFQRESFADVGSIWNETNNSWQQVKVGDFVIRGGSGKYYSCDPAAFHEVYEPTRTS